MKDSVVCVARLVVRHQQCVPLTVSVLFLGSGRADGAGRTARSEGRLVVGGRAVPAAALLATLLTALLTTRRGALGRCTLDGTALVAPTALAALGGATLGLVAPGATTLATAGRPRVLLLLTTEATEA